MKRKIKSPLPSEGKLFGHKSVISENHNTLHPSFCFKYLQKGNFHLDACENEDQLSLIKRLVKLGEMTWAQIMGADRHGLGTEKITKSAIKPSVPVFITEDVNLLAFRFHGKKPMVGYRNGKTFYILWIDRDFTLYDHG